MRRSATTVTQVSMLSGLAWFGWKAGARFALITGRPHMDIRWSWWAFAAGFLTIPALLLVVTGVCLLFRIDPEPSNPWNDHTSGVDL